MKIYSTGRCNGKTAALIKKSAKTGSVIIVTSYLMANYIFDLAKQLNLDIPYPITVTNYRKYLKKTREENLLK